LDRRLSRIMTACPRAAVLFRVHVSSPPWWDESHPGELVKFSTGSTELRGDGPARKRTHASWASENWRTAASASLEALISHLEASPFSRRIIGYELRSGEWGAWQYPGASRGLFADYGEPQQKAYRRWLSERYGSLSSLRAAWGQPVQPLTDSNAVEEGQPILSWQQVEVPSPKERKKSYPGMGVLREPAGSQHVIDYDLFASDLVVETITHLTEIVREVAPGRLCGASYGHIFDHSRVPYLLQNGGHLAVRRLLGVENVDFITTPTAAVADHDIATFSSVGASLAAHGKAAICIPEAVAGRSSSPRGLHTHVAQAIAGGSYLALDAADFAALDEPWRSAVTESAATSHGSRAEVAAVVDDVSCAYTVCGNDLVEPLLDRQRGGLTLLGAPVDVWLLSDIVAGRAPKYKLYVFMNAFYMPEKQREAIISRLAEHKASAIFIYAAGAIDDIISGRKMKALTGLWITRLRGRGPLQVALPDTTYGLAEPVEPRFIGVDRLIAADENAEVLASLQDTGYCGLAARKDGDVRIIWSGAPDMPAALLSKFARQAGIETTTERPAAVYASTDLVAICAPREGTYRVHLPENFHATDLLSGETMGSNGTAVLLDLDAGETALLRLRQIGDEQK
ncbi:MAG: beta-galactosidase, partial [Armatimonadota bacterium]